MIVALDIEPPFPLDTFNMYFQYALGIFKKMRISPSPYGAIYQTYGNARHLVEIL